MTRTWPWLVRGYYADNVKPPKRPGDLAIEIGGLTRQALDMDLAVLRRRPDIGEIVGPFEVPR
jgi:hypothetical protein